MPDNVLATPREAPYAQFALTLGVGVIYAAAFVASVDVVWGIAAVGTAMILALTWVMVVIWRRKPTTHTRWIAVVPLLDMVAVLIIRDSVGIEFGAVGFIMVIPLAWLGLAFSLPTILGGIAFTAGLPVLDAVRAGVAPSTAAEWVGVVIYPALSAIFALSSYAIGQALREERRTSNRLTKQLREESIGRERGAGVIRALIDGTDDPIAVFDTGGNVLISNPASARLRERAGMDIDDFDRPATRLYAADRRTPLEFSRARIAELVAEGASLTRFVWIGSPGDQIGVEYVIRPVVVDGQTIGIVMIGHDVTELAEAVDIRDRFLDTVAHELRTPLTVLLGHVDLALMADVPAPIQARLDTIDGAAQALLTVVERMIGAYRQELRGVRDTTNVAIVLGDVVELLAETADSRGVRLSLVEQPVARALVNPRALRNVLEELVRNAINFSPAGGSVAITTTSSAGVPVIEIIDEGAGMSAAERRQAFTPFFRGAYARENAVPGAGVGLGIAQALAEANEMTIELLPGEGAGTRAILTLPPVGTGVGAGTDRTMARGEQPRVTVV